MAVHGCMCSICVEYSIGKGPPMRNSGTMFGEKMIQSQTMAQEKSGNTKRIYLANRDLIEEK